METPDTSAVVDFTGLLRLDGKGVVVVGAGRGIGRQVCHALAQVGARVLCVDNEATVAEQVAREIGGIACVANAITRVDKERVFRIAQDQLPPVQCIVDIVGWAHIAPIEAVDDDMYAAQTDIVFRHAWLVIQLGAAMLAKGGGGSIVFVGSISGVVPAPNQALYAAQKAAVHQLARASAVEYGPAGVRVNTVAPGTTRTARLLEKIGDKWPEVEATIPLRRTADPADIASVVLFLCSDLARHVTAQTVVVDGGVSATVMRPTGYLTPKPLASPR